MSKQEKLISADKLKDWLLEMMPEPFDIYTENYEEQIEIYSCIINELEEGRFAPDPVPTIKPGDRVNHGYYDEGTVKVYDLNGDGRALVAFDEPDCGERLIFHSELEVVKDE